MRVPLSAVLIGLSTVLGANEGRRRLLDEPVPFNILTDSVDCGFLIGSQI